MKPENTTQDTIDRWNRENPLGVYGNINRARRGELCSRVMQPARLSEDGRVLAGFAGVGLYPVERFRRDATND